MQTLSRGLANRSGCAQLWTRQHLCTAQPAQWPRKFQSCRGARSLALPRDRRSAACPAPAVADDADGAASGDERLQDSLVDMLHVQIGQQHVRDFFDDESEKLRRTAEEAKEEVERLNKLELDRSTLAFGSALADINQSANEFEQQLLAHRKEMEADAAALVTWQRQMAVDRSRGHFFKSLYQPELEQEEIDSLSGAAQQQAIEERQLAPPQTPSPLQLVTCAFLAGVLVTAVALDLAGPNPSFGLDGLYAALGLGFGASAWSQRGAL